MRRTTVVLFVSLLISVSLIAQTPARPADELLRSGLASYRAGNFPAAITDLSAAAQVYLSPEQMEKYVSSGKFENLGGFETALVYLSLAQAKNGDENAARESILRLMTAERISPTYGTLTLEGDAAGFEPLAARLVPDSRLPANSRLAAMPTPTPASEPAPAPTPAPTAAPVPVPVQVAAAAPSAPVPAPVPSEEAERAERERYIERRLAEERVKIERAFEERLAAERVVIQNDADTRVAAAQRAAEERIAAERASIQRTSVPVMVDLMTRRDFLTRLREAEGFVGRTEFRRGADIYLRLARQNDVPRDILSEAATGLYRTGAFREAVEAFTRLGTFARGEEDLRFYHAVALYEVGQFDAARHELSCALPFIQVTDEVTRYRAKIEQTKTM